MVHNYDAEKIDAALQNFYNVTGINISFYGPDFSEVTHRKFYNSNYCKTIQQIGDGGKKCDYSDEYLLKMCKKERKAQMNVCHAGLIDVGVPVIYDEDILGYLILGQMKKDDNFDAIKKRIAAKENGLEKLENYYKDLAMFDEEKVQSVMDIATMLAKHIILEDMLKPIYSNTLKNAVDFIDENLEKNLSVQDIAKSINVSVSVLYKYFRSYYNCTPKDYISKRRVDESVKLLNNTDTSIESISRKMGFSSASYYIKSFKRIKGVTPLEYRKSALRERALI